VTDGGGSLMPTALNSEGGRGVDEVRSYRAEKEGGRAVLRFIYSHMGGMANDSARRGGTGHRRWRLY
jgi:hypothetical protein